MNRLPILGLATVLLLPATTVSAQHTVSLLGGMNLTVIARESADPIVQVGYQRATGLNLGLAGSFMLSPTESLHTLSLQLAGTYSQKGAKLGNPGTDFQLNYLELALLAEMRFQTIVDGIFIQILLGPALGMLLSCQGVTAAANGTPASSSPCEEGRFRDRDHAIAAGSGLEFAFTDRLRVATSFMYTIGLGYIDHSEEAEGGTEKNRALALRAGLVFPIG